MNMACNTSKTENNASVLESLIGIPETSANRTNLWTSRVADHLV